MTTKNQPPIENNDIEGRVALERIQGLYNDSKVVSYTTTIVTTLLGLMLWSSQPHKLVIAWISIHILIAIIRGTVLYRLFKHPMSHLKGAQQWLKAYTLVALFSGCVWASLPWTMFNPSSTYNVSAIVIVMFGMAASSNVALSAFPTAFFCFMFPSLGSLFFRLMYEGGDFSYVGIMLIAFIFFSVVQSLRIYRMMTSSIRQRYENDDLMRNLEIKKAEADKANRDKSRFLAATSHDLRQPLHALDLYLGALEVELSEESHMQILNKTKKSSQAVGELLNALLDVSRLDAGEVVINMQEVFLPDLLADLAAEWEPQLEEDGRKLLSFAVHASIQTDAVLLSRMLRNILANAVRHTKGNVLLGSRKRGNVVQIEVWDQGDGISNTDQEHIFTEFFQINNPERDRTKGLGLGLAIVKRISTLLQHPVQLRSFENKGLCFAVEVPTAETHQTQELGTASNPMDSLDCFVLVIDDEKDIRQSLQMLLRGWGCEVLVSESEQAAISEMTRDQYPAPDIILADYRLRDGKKGTDAATAVSQLFNKSIPTLVITGDTKHSIAQSCKSLGYTLLYKPLTATTLQREMQKAVLKHQR